MKKIFLLLFFMHFINASFCQNKNFEFQIRLPIQLDMQEALVQFSFGNEVKKANCINFGFDALLNYNT